MTSRTKWTDEQLDIVRTFYADFKTEDVATMVGKTTAQTYQKAQALGLRKSEKYLASPAACRLRRGDHVGAEFRFQKGQTAWNKGTKGIVGVQDACRATQFKKGRPAHEARNYSPIGSERVTKDGYLERKMTDDPSLVPARRWTAVHRLVWIAANGPVPSGHVVVFKQGMKTTSPEDITLDRLECITFAENMRRNTLHRYPKEIADLMRMRGVLNRQINRKDKQNVTNN